MFQSTRGRQTYVGEFSKSVLKVVQFFSVLTSKDATLQSLSLALTLRLHHD
ncbi:hypothetical protein OLX23_24250 [Novosphingobium sp. JCM 18896]|nr:hypothetical protein [Novosphingobium sp. JCM 18896]